MMFAGFALRRRVVEVMLFAVLALASCTRQEKQTAANDNPSKPVERTVEKGPITLKVRVDVDSPLVGDRIPLTIEVTAQRGVDVRMPQVGDHVGTFEVAESQTPPDVPIADGRQWSHRYDLRTLDSGEVEIPPFTVKFVDRRNESAIQEGEITSEPITLNVRSLLAGEFDPAKFRDIKDAVAVPIPWNFRPWLYGAAIGAPVLAALLIWLLRKRREVVAPAPPPLPPHIWAMQQLDALAAERLVERGDGKSLHEYFFRLSGIVRQYIERRFGIMAAEQTTDEFLRVARRHTALKESHRGLLSEFLRQADMVKFAKYQPAQYESEAALTSARRFVEETTAIDSMPASGAHNDAGPPAAPTAQEALA